MLRTIGEEAFIGCSGLEGIQLPYGLKEIGLKAFMESELLNITIPSSVRIIR